jgi:hypothetical protein
VPEKLGSAELGASGGCAEARRRRALLRRRCCRSGGAAACFVRLTTFDELKAVHPRGPAPAGRWLTGSRIPAHVGLCISLVAAIPGYPLSGNGRWQSQMRIITIR